MRKTFVNSLPKAGTNLVAKCLQLFGYSDKGVIASSLVLNNTIRAKIGRLVLRPFKQGYIIGIDMPVELSRYQIDKKLNKLGDSMFLVGHLGYTADLLYKIKELGFSPIVIIRDPRAVVNSFVHFVRNLKTHPLYETFNSMTEKDNFMLTVNGMFRGNVNLQPFRIRCMSLDPWLNANGVFKVKFEDLIGSKGGGSDEIQREVLNSICDWLNIPKEKINYVVDNLFGPGRHSFRKGSIDSWKDEIPKGIISLIENEMQDILKKWNYT